jgi:acetyl-CoA/propionyl-CoA carboxylase biotin carboxyl carrier protein
VRAGNLDTGLVGRRIAELAAADLPDDVVGVATGVALLDLEPRGANRRPVRRAGRVAPRGAGLDHPPGARSRARAGGGPLAGPRRRRRAGHRRRAARPDPHHRRSLHTQDGVTRRYAIARGDDGVLWVSRDGRTWAIREQEALEAAAEEATGVGGPVLSPMPGTVTVVEVVEGQWVAAGQKLVAVEAMKMEHVLTAPVDGTVRELRARPGATVAKDAVLLVVEPGV